MPAQDWAELAKGLVFRSLLEQGSVLRIRNHLITAFFILCSSLSAQIISPETWLGFKPGSDRSLADWEQIRSYFEQLAANSERVELQELGATSEGRDLFLAIISSPENLNRKQQIKQALRKLADPRLIHGEAELARIIEATPAVVLINGGLHATEVAAPQFALQYAYDLATARDVRTRKILEETVLLLIPAANPDGIDLVSHWYRETLRTPAEGLAPVQLYHKYAGHDNNRDWFMLNLPETRAITRVLYQEWFPQIIYDLHQMGRSGPRVILPPFRGAVNPHIDPDVVSSINTFGLAMQGALQESDVSNRTTFDMWWHGGFRTAPYYHNMIGLLSEVASARLATPDTLFPRHYFAHKNFIPADTDRPVPEQPRVWRLSHIIEIQRNTSTAVLSKAAAERTEVLRRFYNMGKRAITKGASAAPYAWLIPPDQHDPSAARLLAERLALQGTEIRQATSAFVLDGTSYPAGTLIIPAAQPYRANLLSLLEPQDYPTSSRISPRHEHPYDVTAWTLPLQMGVTVHKANRPVSVRTQPAQLDAWPIVLETPAEAQFYAISANGNEAFLLANRLRRKGVELYRAMTDGHAFRPGDFLIRADARNDALLQQYGQDLAVTIEPVRTDRPIEALALASVSIGVYRGWVPNKDEGWTRYVLDSFAWQYSNIGNAGMQHADSLTRLDVLILPSQRKHQLLYGHRQRRAGMRGYPQQYNGGIGRQGVRQLREFVTSGGTLLCFGDAADAIIDLLELPVSIVSYRRPLFNAPGTLLRTRVDKNAPLAWGMPENTAIFFDNNGVFALESGRSILTYPRDSVRLSGLLQDEATLTGRTALAELSLGRGKIILYGFRPQHRGQTHATFKLIFNALANANAWETVLGETALKVE